VPLWGMEGSRIRSSLCRPTKRWHILEEDRHHIPWVQAFGR
jgi:hypothetical protein